MHYFPVTRHGEVIGYVWASDVLDHGDYIQRRAAGSTGFDAAKVWTERLIEAHDDGLTWRQALHRWAGRAEHPIGGGIPAGAREEEARNLRALEDSAFHVEGEDLSHVVVLSDAGSPPSRLDPGGQRPRGWRAGRSREPVREEGGEDAAPDGIFYVPVTKSGEVIGYLWASAADDDASFVRKVTNSADADLRWYERLDRAEADGLTPREALRRWVGEPEDTEAGGISPGTVERWAPNSQALLELANPSLARKATPVAGYPASAEGAVRYLPITLDDQVLGYLWAAETEDAAGYVRRASAGADGLRAGTWWRSRLAEAREAGLPPLAALRNWVGLPSYLESGGIAADAEEGRAASLRALKDLAARGDREDGS
ncbi:hypothetical protein [Amycolatopsis anabasis]|uniref:hypothetical protein n=1 Tax=Amycolatopsis anabasis TaxID=1840409 RepID=UPI00131B59DA|nr:hypothetical protein [Amycolatopsis anabasis]